MYRIRLESCKKLLGEKGMTEVKIQNVIKINNVAGNN